MRQKKLRIKLRIIWIEDLEERKPKIRNIERKDNEDNKNI